MSIKIGSNTAKLYNILSETSTVHLGNKIIHGVGSDHFDNDYRAILDRAIELSYRLPSIPQQIRQNQLVLDLKSNGIWNEEDIFYVFGNNGSKEFSYLNWKNPSSFECTEVGTMTWNLNEGWNSENSTSSLNTGWTTQTDTVNFTQDDSSVSIFNYTQDTYGGTFAYFFGARDVGDTSYFYSWDNTLNDTLYWVANNQGTTSNISPVPDYSNSLLTINRTLSNRTDLFINGTSIANGSISSVTPATTEPFYIGALNREGAVDNSITSKFSYFSIGSSLNTKQGIKNTLIKQYMVDINEPFKIKMEGVTSRPYTLNIGGSGSVYWEGESGITSSFSTTNEDLTHNYSSYGSDMIISGSITRLKHETSMDGKISFDLGNVPDTVTYLVFRRTNKVSGNLYDLPSGITSFRFGDENTIGGDLANIPNTTNYIWIEGGSELGPKYSYTSGSWNTGISTFFFKPAIGKGLSSTEVDNLIIDLDSNTFDGSLTLTGVNEPRTSASDAEVASISGSGGSVLVNGIEIFPQDNAASIITEVDALGSIENSAATITVVGVGKSDTTVAQSGNYSFNAAQVADAGFGRIQYTFPTISGSIYDISLWAKRGTQTTNPYIGSWTNLTNYTELDILTTNWTEYVFENVASDTTGNAIVKVICGGDGSLANDEVYVDNISIVETYTP